MIQINYRKMIYQVTVQFKFIIKGVDRIAFNLLLSVVINVTNFEFYFIFLT